jgi:hypothetical protein
MSTRLTRLVNTWKNGSLIEAWDPFCSRSPDRLQKSGAKAAAAAEVTAEVCNA